jgi:hypothetical protein
MPAEENQNSTDAAVAAPQGENVSAAAPADAAPESSVSGVPAGDSPVTDVIPADAIQAGGVSISTTTPPVGEPVLSEPAPKTPVADVSPASGAPAQIAQPADAPPAAAKFLTNMANWRQWLQKVYQNRRQKRLDHINKVFVLAQKKGIITKREVQLSMRCGHSTALDYLDELVKQNKLRRVGAFHYKDTYYEVVK